MKCILLQTHNFAFQRLYSSSTPPLTRNSHSVWEFVSIVYSRTLSVFSSDHHSAREPFTFSITPPYPPPLDEASDTFSLMISTIFLSPSLCVVMFVPFVSSVFLSSAPSPHFCLSINTSRIPSLSRPLCGAPSVVNGSRGAPRGDESVCASRATGVFCASVNACGEGVRLYLSACTCAHKGQLCPSGSGAPSVI